MKGTTHLTWLLFLCAISSGAQVAPPPAPILSKVYYPDELDGSDGTGAKPDDLITIEGSGLKDPRTQNPLPTLVLVPTFDASRPSRQRPLEVEPESIEEGVPQKLHFKLPATALAGGYIVQLGTGDSAIKSAPISVNVRPDRVRFFETTNYEKGGVVHSGAPYGVAFNPDGTFWYGGDFWGWNQDNYCSSPARDQFDQGLFLYSPEGKRVQRIDHCASAAVNSQSEHWYNWIQNVQSSGGNPAWTCRFAPEITTCQGTGYASVCDTSGGASMLYAQSPGGPTGQGYASSYYQALTGKGERLYREAITGHYVLMKKIKDPNTGVVTEHPWPAHEDGGLAGKVVRGGRYDLQMYTGAGGHIAFMITRQDATVFQMKREIIRFKPDGTFKDVISLGTDWPYNGAFDCAGNLFLTFRQAWGYPSDSFTVKLKKLAWTGSSLVEVDDNVLRSLGETDTYYADGRHGYLSGVNQQGDLYFYTHAGHRDLDYSGTYPRCISYLKRQNSWIRHPRVRGEGCGLKQDRLIEVDLSSPNTTLAARSGGNNAAMVDAGICNNGSFVPLPELRIPLGNLGSYGIEIEDHGQKRPAKLTRIIVTTLEGCSNEGITLKGSSREPMFNHQCLIIPGSKSCEGDGCRELEIPSYENACPIGFKPGDQPGNGYFQIISVHSGKMKLKYQFTWPTDVAGWETPDANKCGKDLDGNDATADVCIGELSITIPDPQIGSKLSHGNGTATAHDDELAKWADLIGFPSPIMKAIVRQESSGDPRAYRYEPIGTYFGDYSQTRLQQYKTVAGLKDFLMDNQSTAPTATNANACPAGQRPSTKDVLDEDINFRNLYNFVTIDHETNNVVQCKKLALTDCAVSVGQIVLANSLFTKRERSCTACQSPDLARACNDSCLPTLACLACVGPATPVCEDNDNGNWFSIPNGASSYGTCPVNYFCNPFRGCLTTVSADPLPCIIEKMDNGPDNFFGYPAQTMIASSYGLMQVMMPHIVAQANGGPSGSNWLGWRMNETDPKKRGPWEITNPAPPPGAGNWYKINALEIASMFIRLHVGKVNLTREQENWGSLSQAFNNFAKALLPYNSGMFPSSACGISLPYGFVVVERAVGCSVPLQDPDLGINLNPTATPTCTPGYCPKT